MRRRLLASTALIALAAVLVLGLPLGIVESRRAHSQALGRLEREADGVAAAVEDRFESGRPLDLAALHRLLRPGHRVQIVSPAGAVTVVGPPIRGRSIRAGSGVVAGARVIALAPAREVAERARRTWVLIGLLAAGGVAAAIALALVQRRRLARPLEHVARASALLGTGDFSVRAGRFAIPEIDAVASALDASAVRIARLVARQREFGVNVSHQLRTPLTALRLRLEELSLIDDRKLAEHEVSKALAEVDRLEGMVADLLAHAGTGEPGDARALSLDELARAHIASWRALYRRAGRRLTLETAPAPRAWARPGSVGQVLDVLLENALRHGSARSRCAPERATSVPCSPSPTWVPASPPVVSGESSSEAAL